MLTPEYAGALPFSETFDKAAFNLLTDTPACAYIRCYLGMDDTGVIRLIFVAVNDAGEDILPPNDGAVIIEQGSHCPPTCPAPGPLTT